MHTGYQQLILHILLLTKFDLQIHSKSTVNDVINRQDALIFIHSDWFECLCHSINLDPDFVRKLLLKETNVTANRKQRVQIT